VLFYHFRKKKPSRLAAPQEFSRSISVPADRGGGRYDRTNNHATCHGPSSPDEMYVFNVVSFDFVLSMSPEVTRLCFVIVPLKLLCRLYLAKNENFQNYFEHIPPAGIRFCISIYYEYHTGSLFYLAHIIDHFIDLFT